MRRSRISCWLGFKTCLKAAKFMSNDASSELVSCTGTEYTRVTSRLGLRRLGALVYLTYFNATGPYSLHFRIISHRNDFLSQKNISWCCDKTIFLLPQDFFFLPQDFFSYKKIIKKNSCNFLPAAGKKYFVRRKKYYCGMKKLKCFVNVSRKQFLASENICEYVICNLTLSNRASQCTCGSYSTE